MKKILILIITVILISIGIVSCLYINNRNKETQKEVIKNSKIEEEINNNEPIQEDIKDDDNNTENIIDSDDNTNKSNMESNSSSNSNVINNKKQENVKQAKEEKHEKESKPVIQESKPVVTQEPPKKEETEWEKLGISEYDYYNKPMWNWARIDYSVKDYGNFERTHQACIDAGNQLENIVSFSCTNINSYSGAYLGDMLKVKY